jgi:histidinol-phosphate aminotransferase
LQEKDMTNETATLDIKTLIRPNILALEPYHCAREKTLDGILLDANECPYPQDWDGIRLNRYPDPFQRELRQEAASSFGVPLECIAAGAGSDEVLEWIFKVFCQPGADSVISAEPTYGMYQVTARVFGVEWMPFPLGPCFQFNSHVFLAWAPASAKVLFLCSPNNPTGNLLDQDEIRAVCREWRKIVVVDEAYIDFAEGDSMAAFLDENPNLIILRTLSKAYGRAAVRLGFALASEQLVSYFLKVKTPYNVGALPMRLGCEALRNQQAKAQTVRNLRHERERLIERLNNTTGVYRVYPSDANFVLFRCRDAREVVERLFERGIIVRDRSTLPGLADCIRVSVGTKEEDDRFIDELARLLGERRS